MLRAWKKGIMTVAAAALWGLAGCGPPTEPVLVLEPIAVPDQLGERGAYGVARLSRPLRVRGDDSVQVHVYAPADGQGRFLQGPFPPAVFVHGGRVEALRYHWWMTHMASLGFVVIAPEHTLELALFSQGDGIDALEALEALAEQPRDPLHGVLDVGAPGVAFGHSLGGVVATALWLDHPERFELLLLASSQPAPGDAEALAERGARGGRVLSVTGGRDGRISPAEVAQGAAVIADSGAPTTVAVVEGMNHVQWTEEPTEAERAEDDEPTVELEQARQRALWILDSTVRAWRAGPGASLPDTEQWPEGVAPYEDGQTEQGE